MTIQEWFDKGCDYDAGVALYLKNGKDKGLLRVFKMRKSAFNLRKLKYELAKMKTERLSENKTAGLENDKKAIKSPERTVITSKPISHYPESLHEIYQLRIHTFLRAASLKLRLNDVAEDNSEASLVLQIEIWELVKVNQNCWRILNHYDATGEILPTKSESDFSQLSEMEIVNQRQRLYVNVSKRRKTIKKMNLDYSREENEAKKQHLYKKILKKEKELQHFQNDIDELTKRIKNG